MTALLIFISAAPRTRVAAAVTACRRMIYSGCVAVAITAEKTVTITARPTFSIRCCVAANKEAAAGLREGGTIRRGGESYQPSQSEPPGHCHDWQPNPDPQQQRQ
jgi:hypothetical protein